MAVSIWAALSGLFAVVIGVWKFFGRKRRDNRKAAEDAQKTLEKGVKERDPSKITAGFNRSNGIR